MMKSIKCLFGKLSKQYYIILLISCFILLGNSSVKAYVAEGNFDWYDLEFGEYIFGNSGQYAGTVSDNAFNFSSKYFSYTTIRNNNLENKLNYWWESDGLHYTRKYWNESNPINGKINGFYVCSQRPYMQTAYNKLSSANFCTYKPTFLELSTYLNGVDKYSISCGSSNSYTNCMVCLYKYGAGNYICIDDGDSSNNESEFMGVSQIESVAIDNPYVSSSPSSNVPSTGGMVNYTPSNQNIYNTLFKKGYRSQLCYGGFSLDDLFGTGNSSFYDIEAGSGANVFELYNTYGSGLDFITWYDNNYLDYLYFESFRDEYEYSRYIGKSRGLVGLGLVRSTYFKGDSFDTSSYKFFCNLVVNNLVDTSNVSPLDVVDESLSDSIMDSVISDIGILIPTSGSALDVLFKSYFSGDFADCISGDNFTGCFKDPIDSSWRAWSLNGIKTDAVGILPKYIVWAFLGILLLYYLRR